MELSPAQPRPSCISFHQIQDFLLSQPQLLLLLVHLPSSQWLPTQEITPACAATVILSHHSIYYHYCSRRRRIVTQKFLQANKWIWILGRIERVLLGVTISFLSMLSLSLGCNLYHYAFLMAHPLDIRSIRHFTVWQPLEIMLNFSLLEWWDPVVVLDLISLY